MPITHAKVSGVADGGDAAQVQPSDWNAAHVSAAGTLAEVLSVTVDLSAADIASLNSVPVEVVAAQGAGTVIVPVAASFQYLAGSEPFAGERELRLVYGVADSALLSWSRMFVKLHLTTLQAFPFLPVLPDFTTNEYEAQNQADIEDQPLTLLAHSLDPGYTGSTLTASLAGAGTGYAPGDTGTIDAGDGLAAYEVDTVGGGGEVATFHITAAGTGYTVEELPTIVTTGGGDGAFTINVDSITPLSDGTARLTVLYYVMELLT